MRRGLNKIFIFGGKLGDEVRQKRGIKNKIE
jgi:hypothetical protein